MTDANHRLAPSKKRTADAIERRTCACDLPMEILRAVLDLVMHGDDGIEFGHDLRAVCRAWRTAVDNVRPRRRAWGRAPRSAFELIKVGKTPTDEVLAMPPVHGHLAAKAFHQLDWLMPLDRDAGVCLRLVGGAMPERPDPDARPLRRRCCYVGAALRDGQAAYLAWLRGAPCTDLACVESVAVQWSRDANRTPISHAVRRMFDDATASAALVCCALTGRSVPSTRNDAAPIPLRTDPSPPPPSQLQRRLELSIGIARSIQFATSAVRLCVADGPDFARLAWLSIIDACQAWADGSRLPPRSSGTIVHREWVDLVQRVIALSDAQTAFFEALCESDLPLAGALAAMGCRCRRTELDAAISSDAGRAPRATEIVLRRWTRRQWEDDVALGSVADGARVLGRNHVNQARKCRAVLSSLMGHRDGRGSNVSMARLVGSVPAMVWLLRAWPHNGALWTDVLVCADDAHALDAYARCGLACDVVTAPLEWIAAAVDRFAPRCVVTLRRMAETDDEYGLPNSRAQVLRGLSPCALPLNGGPPPNSFRCVGWAKGALADATENERLGVVLRWRGTVDLLCAMAAEAETWAMSARQLLDTQAVCVTCVAGYQRRGRVGSCRWWRAVKLAAERSLSPDDTSRFLADPTWRADGHARWLTDDETAAMTADPSWMPRMTPKSRAVHLLRRTRISSGGDGIHAHAS